MTVLLFVCILVLMISSMGVSRMIFPWFPYLGSADLHRYLATAVLALSVLHAGLSIRRRSEHKRRVTAAVLLLTALSVAAGAFLLGFGGFSQDTMTMIITAVCGLVAVIAGLIASGVQRKNTQEQLE